MRQDGEVTRIDDHVECQKLVSQQRYCWRGFCEPEHHPRRLNVLTDRNDPSRFVTKTIV